MRGGGIPGKVEGCRVFWNRPVSRFPLKPGLRSAGMGRNAFMISIQTHSLGSGSAGTSRPTDEMGVSDGLRHDPPDEEDVGRQKGVRLDARKRQIGP